MKSLFRRSSHPATAQAILSGETPPPSKFVDEVPPLYDLICLKCLARDPDERYQSALELRRDLLDLRHVLASTGNTPEERLAERMEALFEDREKLSSYPPAVLPSALADDTIANPSVPLLGPAASLGEARVTREADEGLVGGLRASGSNPPAGTHDESFLVSTPVGDPSSRPWRKGLLALLFLLSSSTVGYVLLFPRGPTAMGTVTAPRTSPNWAREDAGLSAPTPEPSVEVRDAKSTLTTTPPPPLGIPATKPVLDPNKPKSRSSGVKKTRHRRRATAREPRRGPRAVPHPSATSTSPASKKYRAF